MNHNTALHLVRIRLELFWRVGSTEGVGEWGLILVLN